MEKYIQAIANESNDFDLEYETRMLMYRFLGIVDEIMETENISKKSLAEMIGTSPSYITQLFNGSKIINLSTLAKIQHALHIKFKIEDLNRFENLNDKRIEEYIKNNNNISKDFFLVYKNSTELESDQSLHSDPNNDDALLKYA